MKPQADPITRRVRPLPDDAFPVEFEQCVHACGMARDAHRMVCDRDAVECDAYPKHAQAIAEAKRALHRDAEPP